MPVYFSLIEDYNPVCQIIGGALHREAPDSAAGQVTPELWRYISQFIPAAPPVEPTIACGYGFTLFLRNNGSVYGCGSNEYNQLGRGSQTDHPRVQRLPALPEGVRVIQIAAGAAHTLLLGSDGSIYGCGKNNYGQLGLGDTNHRNEFAQLPALPGWLNITQMATGNNYTLLLGSDGSVYGCGVNYYGQLGLGDFNCRDRLIQLPAESLPQGITITQIAAGAAHTLLLGSNGNVYGCGSNDYGQLGVGDFNRHPRLVQFPVESLPRGVTITQIAAGRNHTVVLGSNGNVYGCGSNHDGQLGRFDIHNRDRLEQLPALPEGVRVTQIAAGNDHTLLLGSNGRVYGCGSNRYGELGLGHTTDSSLKLLPLELPPRVRIIKLFAGGNHSFFLASNGAVYGWGNNSNGQLALGDIIHRLTPTRIER